MFLAQRKGEIQMNAAKELQIKKNYMFKPWKSSDVISTRKVKIKLTITC